MHYEYIVLLKPPIGQILGCVQSTVLILLQLDRSPWIDVEALFVYSEILAKSYRRLRKVGTRCRQR